VKLQDEALAVIANVGHPLRHAKQLALYGLAPYRWVVNRANMSMRRLREGGFRDCGLRLPQHLLETTSAFATLALLALASQSEPYELVTRKGGDGFARRQTADQRMGPSPTLCRSDVRRTRQAMVEGPQAGSAIDDLGWLVL
jgi:hypothetical protein